MKPSDHDTIVNQLIPEFVKKFRNDQQQYGDGHRSLGPAGQFADIWRKITPLKRALWEGRRLPNENPRQILMDLIGHCFLTLAMLDAGDWEWPALDARDSQVVQLSPTFYVVFPPDVSKEFRQKVSDRMAELVKELPK